MEDNEDEPEDVRKATPVAGEIESGRKDEKAGDPRATRSDKKDAKKPSRCEKDAKKPTLAKSEADCCRGRITKPAKTPKMMSVMVYSPPCTLPRLEIIPRHCLSKREYIDILASPSRKCPLDCFGKTVVRKIRPISARMNELAQPARRLIVGTLKERGETLPPEMISNLVKSIEDSACMTPEQAEKYFRDKEREKERKVGKTRGRQKCKGKSKGDQCSSQLDKEAVMCQYLMAERFVKSILRWKCPIPVEEFQDIASVILRRLSFVLEYTPTDGQDLKSQQMRFLADIIACWISGVLFEVAEEHKKEIEEGLIAREKEEEDEDEDDEEDDEEVEEPAKPVQETDDDEEEKEEEQAVQRENEKEKRDSGNKNGKDGDDGAKAPEDSVVIKTEPLDEDNDNSETLVNQEEADKEAEERENQKRIQEQEEERARKEAEEKAKMEEEEEAKRKKEAEEKKLRKEEEEEKRKKQEEEENRLRIEAEEKVKKEQEEEEEKRKKKELEEEEEEKRKKQAEEEEKERIKKEQEEEEQKRLKKEQEEEEEKRVKKEQAEEEEKRTKEEQAEEEEKRKRQEQERAEEARKKKAAEDQKKKKREEEVELKRIGPKKAIEGIGDGELFETDLPFVTFGRILDTVYDMLEEEPEGDETDIIHNRIQRSLYEKFARLIELEAPDSLTENLKDVVDVFAGKAATWVKRLLKDSELKFMADNPAEVESKEIRDWGKWIDQVTDRAGDWADWIHRVVNEAEEKSATIVHRGDWQNWTSDMETNALLWRRYYLETIHQAHHNKMMVADRPVVKTGLSADEEEINNTDLAA